MFEPRIHGGPDAQGKALHDFSTNGNACGPCPPVLQALRKVDARHYPDASYTVLREALAAFHEVAVHRIVLAASASEFIFRISARVAQQACGQQRTARVELPLHGYGDYRHAATAWGLALAERQAQADLIWACDPASPTGHVQAGLAQRVNALTDGQTLVLDGAYRPLRLEGALALSGAQLDRVWQLWSPNKVLCLTGIRAAYAIAPVGAQALVARLERLAPSWPIGAHGCAMLSAWVRPDVQDWLAASRCTLQRWKRRQLAMCTALGWPTGASVANFHLATPDTRHMAQDLAALRAQGIQLRDASSFGLPGQVRMGVLSPAAQDALWHAWKHIKGKT
mgnify:CR=1 FL=1